MILSSSQGQIFVSAVAKRGKKKKKGSHKKESGTLILKYIISNQQDSLFFYHFHGLSSFHAVSLASRINNAVMH